MAPFGKLSRPAKIARLFAERATELHVVPLASAIKSTVAETRLAMPYAKDILKAEYGLRLTPIIERDGWWTATPTHRIAVLALQATSERHQGEWRRSSRVFADFGLGGEGAEPAVLVPGEPGL